MLQANASRKECIKKWAVGALSPDLPSTEPNCEKYSVSWSLLKSLVPPTNNSWAGDSKPTLRRLASASAASAFFLPSSTGLHSSVLPHLDVTGLPPCWSLMTASTALWSSKKMKPKPRDLLPFFLSRTISHSADYKNAKRQSKGVARWPTRRERREHRPRMFPN